MNPATHHVTVEHHAPTGNEVGDGMGGTTTEREWQPIVADVPARYVAAGEQQSQGRATGPEGEVIREAPKVEIDPQHVGHVEDGAYVRDVEAGNDWRVAIHGLAGEERRQLIDNVHERYGFGPMPTSVTLELELQDE